MLSSNYVGDGDYLVKDVSTLDEAASQDISFFNNKKYFNSFKKTKAQCILVEKKAKSS